MSTAVWQARTGSGLHPDLLAYSQTIAEDRPFLVHDLAGSSAHVLGLAKAGLLTKEEAKQLLAGLRLVLRDHEAGTFALDVELEDVHMNVEARLTAQLGDVGRRLHTGRSRNDQVATCIVLYARTGLARLAQGLGALADAVARKAEANLETPWVARTHGMPAQPATVGFLLAAHAHRLQDAAKATLAAFEAVGESPLGSGAIGGSTLPLDPAYTARLMGLRAPRSALLATGTRDAVLLPCLAAQQAGLALASLSQDLIDLFKEGALRLPPGYTTGSSLMPQKRNPDALELARGRSKALAGPAAAVSAILSGLELGYQRDFQLTKPHLVAALGDAAATAELLAPLADGMQCLPAGAEWGKPGIVATDVAEALVRAGQPFRTAYATVAQAFAKVESGMTFQAALESMGLPADHLEAALAALQPDPSRRATVGGPAPSAVKASLSHFAAQSREVAARVAAAQKAAELPIDLLTRPTDTLLES
ncbi:MAG TPA: argininosuccinate lyase [Candidatus Thermoplasmatota archaeon]|nr:argininosuccinate lyase [Candidatus Thermoplasmatota archaeon]